jgi:hypothetical protein
MRIYTYLSPISVASGTTLAVPSGSTDGAALPADTYAASSAALAVHADADSTVSGATLYAYADRGDGDRWYRIGALHDDADIVMTADIGHEERVHLGAGWKRIAVSGTATSTVEIYLQLEDTL